MAKCEFSFDTAADAGSLIAKARTAITGIGGELNGNDTEGTFKIPTPLGTVKGNYIVSTGSVKLSITDKPMLIGCGVIEEKLRDYMAS